MKKFIALFLCIMMVCASLTSAMAATISGTLSSTTEFSTIAGPVNIDGDYWSAAFSGATASCRVVVRVHAGYNAASAKWVYSGYSSTSHPYLDEYKSHNTTSVTLRGRIDDRDSGTAKVSGTFTP